ncbi:hypothetical protein JTB14_032585 [Gonioctena quinquepunctata]|nr:hypothetical protein JTB14_032585 [Gonioctena quinquepunctata]
MLFLFSVLLYCTQVVFSDETIVTLPNGKIQGFVDKTRRYEKTFYTFSGIPFAAPPVGNLRFQPPQPVKNWDGVLETKSLSKTCYQVLKPSTTETEDCLYLNVFTPAKPGSISTLPVMVNIYGGAFIHGSAMFGNLRPQNFLEKDVIVVDFNYRIGPFGFLSTEDTVIPGNMGLKDQQFALKWVQTNIHLFGGDPKKVTIMGQSAGGASVTYQILSLGSQGLFRAAIAQSASALCNWASQRHPLGTAYGMAVTINSSFSRHSSTEELRDFLVSVDASSIAKTGSRYAAFAPVVEVPHAGAFITEPMFEMMEQGKFNRVPLFIGYCSEEQISYLRDLPKWENTVKTHYGDPKSLFNENMNINDTDTKETVGKIIKNIYTNESFVDHLGKSIQLFSDNQYIRPVIKFAELQSKYADVYFYQFSFQGKISDNHLSNEGVSGVGHAEDMKYLWTYYTSLNGLPEADIRTLDRYLTLNTNFAKYLNPIPEDDELFNNLTLPKMRKDEMYYVDINKEFEVKTNPREFSFSKWSKLYEDYSQPPRKSF